MLDYFFFYWLLQNTMRLHHKIRGSRCQIFCGYMQTSSVGVNAYFGLGLYWGSLVQKDLDYSPMAISGSTVKRSQLILWWQERKNKRVYKSSSLVNVYNSDFITYFCLSINLCSSVQQKSDHDNISSPGCNMQRCDPILKETHTGLHVAVNRLEDQCRNIYKRQTLGVKFTSAPRFKSSWATFRFS